LKKHQAGEECVGAHQQVAIFLLENAFGPRGVEFGVEDRVHQRNLLHNVSPGATRGQP
jgi:hypothetical protein